LVALSAEYKLYQGLNRECWDLLIESRSPFYDFVNVPLTRRFYPMP